MQTYGVDGFKFDAGEIVRIFRALPMIWRGVTVLTVNAILDLIFVCMIVDRGFSEIGVFLSLSKTVILFGLGIYAAIFMRRLQKGAQALADGNLSYQTDTKAMYWDFKKHGEKHFRDLESEVIADFGRGSGCIIATGGGCVTREENLPLLQQNGQIFWLKRDIGLLPKEGRPLSLQNDLQQIPDWLLRNCCIGCRLKVLV